MNVFELAGTIAIKNKDANEALKDTAQKAERTGKQIQEAFKKVGSATVKAGKWAIGTATAISAAFTATVESTRDYRTAMAQLETTFTKQGYSAETATKTYKALQAVLGDTDQTVEAVTALAQMCENEEDLAKWTDICTGVFAEYQGKLPIEGLAEAANETANVGVVTGNLADALNWAGVSEDDFNLKLRACRTEQERQKLILDTLYPMYKDSADMYKVNAENIMKANEAQDNLNSAMAKLGEIGEPILTGAKNWIADMVNASIPHLESIISAFSNFGKTWEDEVWPAIQEDWKTAFGVELPDWPTLKQNIADGWATIKEGIANSFIINAIIDIPKNWSQMATDIANGWDETVLPAIKDKFKAVFGVDMPTWTDISTSIATGWDETIYPAITDFFKVTFGVDMPSWTDVTNSIKSGWNSVKASIAGLFHIDATVTPTVTGNFGGGGNGVSGAEYGRTFGGSLTRTPESKAVGLDNVPYDGFYAHLHKGEAILNKAQADQWRGGSSGKVEALLAQLVANTSGGQMVVLDSGVLVGQIASQMDTKLGTIGNRKGRGN